MLGFGAPIPMGTATLALALGILAEALYAWPELYILL